MLCEVYGSVLLLSSVLQLECEVVEVAEEEEVLGVVFVEEETSFNEDNSSLTLKLIVTDLVSFVTVTTPLLSS